MNPIPARLKKARLNAGLSQKNLGIIAGIDRFSASARMNQYEKGKHIPDFLMLKNIAKALSVPVAYFYAEDDKLAEFLIFYEQSNKEIREKILQSLLNSEFFLKKSNK